MQIFKKIIVYILILESRLVLKKYKPFIVAVTGSVGKTATKDAIYDVLRQRGGHVRKSEKSFNSDIGLPLTILGVPNAWRHVGGWIENIKVGLKLISVRQPYPDTLVLEVGADHPGDIRNIARWLRPDIAVVTKVGSTPVHVEFFDSPEEVFKEKASLAEYMKDKGTLILIADEPKVLTIADMVKDKQVHVVTFGISEQATVRGFDQVVTYDEQGAPSGFSFKLNIGTEVLSVNVPHVIGLTYMYPLLVATAVGNACGMSNQLILRGLNSYQPPKGRMNIIQGINGSTLVDDTYNSSPDAVSAALVMLKGLTCKGAKIAVLGDMMELGKYSSDQHRQIGKEVVGSTDHLVTIGQRSRATADEAIKSGFSADKINSFDTSVDAATFLVSVLKTRDIILVKGSQSIRAERVTKALLREPEKADKLLVRQEKEWLEKK